MEGTSERVPGFDRRAHRIEKLAPRLEDQRHLFVVLDLALPVIEAGNRREDIGAGRQPLADAVGGRSCPRLWPGRGQLTPDIEEFRQSCPRGPCREDLADREDVLCRRDRRDFMTMTLVLAHLSARA